jgi:SAM-dependent methyltransferase
MGEILQAQLGCSVVGVTADETEGLVARTRLSRVEIVDLNSFDLAALGRFDCVLCCHVLEHLYSPESVLTRLHACLHSGGSLVVALPNVLFWRQRWQFLRGRFRYSEGGIMDRTHIRFYDWRSAREMLSASGYIVERAAADGGFPLSRLLWQDARIAIDDISLRLFPGLFGWQFIFRCHALA